MTYQVTVQIKGVEEGRRALVKIAEGARRAGEIGSRIYSTALHAGPIETGFYVKPHPITRSRRARVFQHWNRVPHLSAGQRRPYPALAFATAARVMDRRYQDAIKLAILDGPAAVERVERDLGNSIARSVRARFAAVSGSSGRESDGVPLRRTIKVERFGPRARNARRTR